MSVDTRIQELVEYIATEMKAINDLAGQNLFGEYVVNDTLLARLPLTHGGASLVGNAKTKWRFEGREWGGASDTIWDLIQTGTGMTIGVDGVSGGSRYLKITSGTTINDETIIMSKEIFKPPFIFSFGLTMSQRIANTEVHIELVEVDDNGDVIIDNSLFSAPNFNNARSGCGLKYDGTTANNASIKIRSRGISELVKTSTSHGTNFSVATGTTPNFNPTLQGEISFTTDRIITAGRIIDSNALRTEGGRSTAYVPDQDGQYKIRLRVKNLGTAPASSTDVRLHFGKIIDHTRISVDFGAIAGSLNASDSIPVYNTNNISTITLNPSATYGSASYHHLISANTTNATSVKTSAGNINDLTLCNNSLTNPAYFKLYNKASAPTVGTDTPTRTVMIPANSTIQIGFGTYGVRNTAGIAYAITGGMAVNDTTAISATQVSVSISYT